MLQVFFSKVSHDFLYSNNDNNNLFSNWPLVTRFKLQCFELVLRDAALVQSPQADEFSASVYDASIHSNYGSY